jgi:hypothetical protein
MSRISLIRGIIEIEELIYTIRLIREDHYRSRRAHLYDLSDEIVHDQDLICMISVICLISLIMSDRDELICMI